MIRVGIVGCGNIFRRGYLPALPSAESVRVAAVCDLLEERAREAKALTGAEAYTTDDAALFGRKDVDAVFILTPSHTHDELAVQALQAGKHVLCEKPMARTPAGAKRMIEAAQAAGKRLMIGHTRHFDDRWTSILDQVRSGRIGDLVYMFRSEHAFNGAPKEAWQWRGEESGGVLWDVGVHVVELFQWFMRASPRRVYSRLLYNRPEAREGGAPDAAVAQLDFGNDCHALYSVSWFHPPAWGSFYANMELIGRRGKLTYFDRDAHSLALVGGATEFPRYSPLLSALAHTFAREIEHFARGVETGEPFAVSTDDALRAVATIDAAERSARSGRVEEVVL
ncbi:MAG: Gfo/Idh/MocA family oxidoreductase [Planctomycetes bacterium]|nr:Gfo/Idh/MocA family oxidoreductase [Planctomycetota bacterium]